MLLRFGMEKSGHLLCDFHSPKVFFLPDRVSQTCGGEPGELSRFPKSPVLRCQNAHDVHWTMKKTRPSLCDIMLNMYYKTINTVLGFIIF